MRHATIMIARARAVTAAVTAGADRHASDATDMMPVVTVTVTIADPTCESAEWTPGDAGSAAACGKMIQTVHAPGHRDCTCASGQLPASAGCKSTASIRQPFRRDLVATSPRRPLAGLLPATQRHLPVGRLAFPSSE